MNRSLFAVTTALALGVPSFAHAGTGEAEAQRIQALQVRAEQSLAGKTGTDAYALARARAWLDLALDELYEDDRTGIVQAATLEAEKLLAHPQAALPFTMPAATSLPGAEVVREDLWNRISAMHASPDFGCAARQLGQLEVLMYWAGHEKWESGWSHARPYAEQAENQAYDAETAIRQCEAARPANKPATAAAPAAASPAPLMVEHFTFSTDALFEFGKDGIEHLVAGGERKLGALANSLKAWKSIEKIEITGYTDRLGSSQYNDRLSRQRAEHVRDYFVAQGLSADRVATSGRGESDPLVDCRGTRKTPGLIACLQPNRRVEITVHGAK